jgi:hypothetical protein
MDRQNPYPLTTNHYHRWLLQSPSTEFTLTPDAPAVLPSAPAALPSAAFVNEVFFEQIMPNIGNVIEDVASDPDNASENGLDSLSEVLRAVGPVEPVDEDQLAIAFAAQQRSTFSMVVVRTMLILLL